ncbi:MULTISPECIES: pyridoxal phosphate-dependent aminotransferase [Cyanophyceae]|uniref:pyridoxal phosphate-dependent aminotransferase n=1 Tax=Cyanophyceae TaxID=3028117 RepID=UPI00232B9A13|nr:MULTISPECIES: pyridoxal phosphate-dependent aminotransferase [Cyanophyceae]MDB9305010.1 pyridoxal phosphate-dependent aminotransferase [Nodularia spumigena CS-591/12]MDB9318750.1 pyridoxal phosphate-dependent aminotransferase [Nodularia spumigena CS-590/01A]MDB9327171.1 pyridoxal phosphate-dependent aminotransferase [Nodularia spumigena CS-590/02]MDB9335699.1 pyridoxal phosphate-dependent aminotransferase [Nodularia spumigena CS-590/01]MDB9339122.1 pyridoxal phosphate-dependent aminotransfe
MQPAKRLEKIPPYLFAEINRKREQLLAQGVDIINLAVGDPDKQTPAHILQAMHQAIDDGSTHNYPPYQGTREFRAAAVNWMERRFGVTGLNPETEVISSIGSKEAIHNTFLAFVEAGDYTIIPDPGYPVYQTATIFAGGEPYTMPLKAENNFLPDLNTIPEEIARKAKLLWINYPNNPTGALASLDFFAELVAFCKQYNILLCHDHAYSEMAYDGYKPPSVLQVRGAKDVAIEFHSLSKSYNMTGWRIGFVVGSAIGIQALRQVKTNVDSGVFKAIQKAAIAAYSTSEAELQALMSVYQKRRDIIVQGLQSLGWPIEPPQATLYVWVPVPPGYSSTEFVSLLLDKCGIMVTPGNGYGAAGEGFFRIALTIPDERMHEAIQRIKDAGIRYA